MIELGNENDFSSKKYLFIQNSTFKIKIIYV